MNALINDLIAKRDRAETKLDWLILNNIIQKLVERVIFQ